MELNDVIAKGVLMMEDKTVLVKGNYEPEDQPWHAK
jgi:hypothetical protein